MKNASHLPPDEILGLAIRSEMDAADVYARLYDAVKNILLRKKLQFLIFEEKQHRKILEKLYIRRFPEKELVLPEHSFLPPIKAALDKKASVRDLFNVALKAEKRAEDFYDRAGEKAQDENSRRILFYLSRVERSHYFMIKSEIDLLERFPDYFNVEDFQIGQDMIHIGP